MRHEKRRSTAALQKARNTRFESRPRFGVRHCCAALDFTVGCHPLKLLLVLAISIGTLHVANAAEESLGKKIKKILEPAPTPTPSRKHRKHSTKKPTPTPSPETSPKRKKASPSPSPSPTPKSKSKRKRTTPT